MKNGSEMSAVLMGLGAAVVVITCQGVGGPLDRVNATLAQDMPRISE